MSTHTNFIAFTPSENGGPGTFDVNIVRGVAASGNANAVYFDRVAHAVRAQDLWAYHVVLPNLMDRDPRNFWAYVNDKLELV